MSNQAFKFFGNSMENISIKYGIFLVLWGAIISWASASLSFTSWIPTMLGLPIFLFGWIARLNPLRRKVCMHFAVFFGLLTFLGGLTLISDIFSVSGAFNNPYASSSKLILLVSGGIYFFICIQSFRFARSIKN